MSLIQAVYECCAGRAPAAFPPRAEHREIVRNRTPLEITSAPDHPPIPESEIGSPDGTEVTSPGVRNRRDAPGARTTNAEGPASPPAPRSTPRDLSDRSGPRTHLVLVEVGLAGQRPGEVRERAPEQPVVGIDAVGEDADQGRIEAE